MNKNTVLLWITFINCNTWEVKVGDLGIWSQSGLQFETSLN